MSYLASLTIWFDRVFVATAAKRWKTLAIASTVWRRWLPACQVSYRVHRLATVATRMVTTVAR